MEFYIYENSQWTKVYVEIEPTLTKAFDTTNDSFSCVLQASTKDIPYEPMTPFKIIDDDNKTTIMWLINDTVNVFSNSPLTYKHTLNIVQFRYFLNKHLVRNTVFNQPRKRSAKIYAAMTNYLAVDDAVYSYRAVGNISPTYWTDFVSFGTKGNIKDAVCEIKLWGTYQENQKGILESISVIDEGFNFNIKPNAAFSIIDSDSNYTIISGIKISSFGSKFFLTQAQITTLNTYLKGHLGATLSLGFTSGGAGGDEIENAFCETVFPSLSATYSSITVQIIITFEIYNYTMYDVIKTLLEQYRLQTDNFGYKREKLFNLPVSGDLYDLLTNTYPPDNLSFTQATFYDALAEIFRFYDAGFKFDENKNLQIEYYNDPQELVSDIKTSGLSLTHSEQNFNNGRVAYYQNAINSVKLKEIPTRCQNLGVPNQNGYSIILPYPIYDITKIEYLANSFSFTFPFGSDYVSDGNLGGSKNPFPLDISYFVINSEEWSVLNKESSPTGKVYTLKQITSIPFTRGDKTINVSTYNRGYGGTTFYVLEKVLKGAICRFYGFPDWTGASSLVFGSVSPAKDVFGDQRFNIEYTAMNNGRLETQTINNQYGGEMLVNQGSGMVDLNKLGLNMFGESLKNGQPVLTATHEITDWENRIKEGEYIIYCGSMWLANIVNYTPLGNGAYQGKIEFSKNFNALSLRVENDKQKRLTSISAEQTMMSEDTYIDYVYVDDTPFFPQTSGILLNHRVIESLVGQTFGLDKTSYTGYENINFGVIESYVRGSKVTDSLYLPLIKYGAGNCICFEFQYDSPINAGNQLVKETQPSWAFGADSYYSQAALYTDKEGWADDFNVSFVAENYTMGDFPKISSFTPVGQLEHLKYHKKPNEIFGLNYELCFLPQDKNDFFIGSAFINNNAFTDINYDEKIFYLYYDDSEEPEEYTILDKLGKGKRVQVSVGTRWGTNYAELCILTPESIDAYTWALCDRNGNIYFASNHTKSFSSDIDFTTSIYFATRKTKAKDDDETIELPPPSYSGSYTFYVKTTDWRKYQNTWVTGAAIQPPYYAIDIGGKRVYYKSYSYQSLLLIGVQLSSVVIENTITEINNTVSYDAATGTFSGTIYTYNQHEPQEAKITYVRDIYSSYFHYQEIKVPSLVGATVLTKSITPSSAMIDGQIYFNTIEFDKSRGIFKVFVYSATPTGQQYTIEWTV